MAPEGQLPDAPDDGGRSSLTGRLSEWVDALEHAATELREFAAEYRKLTRSGTDDPYAVASWLRKRAAAVESMDALPVRLGEFVATFEDEAQEALLRLETDLREALGQRGWKVDGQWPRLYVERVIRVEIDEKEHRATVGETEVTTFHIGALISAVEEQLRHVLPARFDPKRFIEILAKCYDRLVSSGARGVPIWDLFREVLISNQTQTFWRSGRRSLFRPLGEQTFRASLRELLERGPITTADGRELTLLPPLKAEDAMYLYHPAENRFAFVGRVEFMSPVDRTTE